MTKTDRSVRFLLYIDARAVLYLTAHSACDIIKRYYGFLCAFYGNTVSAQFKEQ